MTTTDYALSTRHPQVSEYRCPSCGFRLGFIVDVNGDEWIRDASSGWTHRNTVSVCPSCLMLVKYRSPKGRR